MFRGKVVLVTGGGSGIGAAMARELRQRGAVVVTADLAGGDVELDVRDRSAFAAVVGDVVAEHGRIDVLFNNAGVAAGGETHLLDGAHFDRVVDVDLGGVVNGVLAAYPRMVAQGHGQIVNTASMAGLAPAPMTAAYSMAKHGVVGLSLTLRPEAALHGVRVNVLCPGAVDTPILDAAPPPDLPAPPGTLTAREYMAVIRQRPIDPARFVGPALRGVERNRAVIVVPASGKALWYLQRLSPGAVQAAGRLISRRVRRAIEA